MDEKSPFHIAKALEFGWDVLTRRWLALVLWTVVLWIPHGMINAASTIFALFSENHESPVWLKVASVVVQLITLMLSTRVTLLCMDDEPAGLGNVLSAFKFTLPFTAASIIFVVLVGCGLVLFVIPGIYVGLAMGLYSYLIVDQQMGPIEALKRSICITKGHLLKLLALYFTLSMVVFGGLICFVVGVLPASIVCSVALGRVYRQLDRAYDGVEDDADDALTADSEQEAAG